MISRLLDFIWPRECEVCHRPVDRPGRYVCSECLMRLPFIPTEGCCRKCGRDVPELDREFRCQDCRESRPSFDRAASALRFAVDAREMLVAFKSKNHLWLRNDFADWLEATARARFLVEEIDLVVAMPSTWKRRYDRGYNQCDYLAAPLAKRLGVAFVKRAIKRTGNPKRQSTLSEEERKENVKGTFLVRKPAAVAGKTVMVVDDVMTTGATLSECAKALKVAGAKRVWCISLLRSLGN